MNSRDMPLIVPHSRSASSGSSAEARQAGQKPEGRAPSATLRLACGSAAQASNVKCQMTNAKSDPGPSPESAFGTWHSAFGIDCEVTWSALTEPIRDVEANDPRSKNADGQVELRQAHRRAGREVGDVHE